jgi:hypothetical protein
MELGLKLALRQQLDMVNQVAELSLGIVPRQLPT